MVLIQGEPFLMGAPYSDRDRKMDEPLHRKRIERQFALSTTAITLGQYRVYQEEALDSGLELVDNTFVRAVVKTDDSPITAVSIA